MQHDKANKWCPKCQQYLSRELFYRNAAQFDGLSPYCRVCWTIYNREAYAKGRAGMPDKRRIQQGEDTKQCSRCQEVKPVSDFYKNKEWIDGFHPYCKKCVLAYQKEKRELKRDQSPGLFRWKRDLVRHDYFAQID